MGGHCTVPKASILDCKWSIQHVIAISHLFPCALLDKRLPQDRHWIMSSLYIVPVPWQREGSIDVEWIHNEEEESAHVQHEGLRTQTLSEAKL